MERLLIALFLAGFSGGVALCYSQLHSVTWQFASLWRTGGPRGLGQKNGETESAQPPASVQ